jgi:hypothetical protein
MSWVRAGRFSLKVLYRMPKIERRAESAQSLAQGASQNSAPSATGYAAQDEPQRLTQRVFGPMIAAGAASYSRVRDLPKLLALPPDEIEDDGIAATERIVTKLAARSRAQALLGRRRHWSYDLNRHLALLTAFKAERAHLAHLRNAESLAEVLGRAVAKAEPEAA